MTDGARKNWGTIFMGADREVDLGQLSSAAQKGGGLWTRDQETVYLERVQRRAEERAREVLSGAGAERAALLKEAGGEIARMREEAEQRIADLRAESENLKSEALRLHEEARLLYAGAEEAGYAAGVGQAHAELEHFRAVMGESVGALLSAIHAQCDNILDVWKEDLCGLLQSCVEKGTGLVLDQDRKLLLERLFLESVKLFEARSAVTALVRPEDEAVVADMFAAAKERLPGLDAWTVQGDPALAPGDMVLEAAHSRVESRVEERRSAVEAALRHISLPVVPEEERGREKLAQVHAGSVARMLELLPGRPFVPAALQGSAADGVKEMPIEEISAGEADAQMQPPATDVAAADRASVADMPEQLIETRDMAAPEEQPVPRVDLSRVHGRQEAAEAAAGEPGDAQEAVNGVLAEGGFLPVIEEA